MNGQMVLWRQMESGDLDGVMAVANAVHPDLPESREVLAERLELFPRGCLVLERDGVIGGYAISHPIRPGEPPSLDTLLGAIPADAATYYIHDVALLPSFRGGGLARRGVLRLLEIARHFDRTGLIAVYDAAHFWARFGFVASNRVARAKLAAYGEGAAYMEKQAAPAVAG